MFKIIFEIKYNNPVPTNRIIFRLIKDQRTIEFIDIPIMNNGRYSNKTEPLLFIGIDLYHNFSYYDYSAPETGSNRTVWIPGAVKI